LSAYGYTLEQVSDLFVTHIHLDHAGAAGWLAKNGTQVYVHPVGAPHLINPEALLISARRIYAESMDMLWGTVLPVGREKITPVEDGETVHLGPHAIRAVDTPGHAYHHHAYIYEGVCFSGDVGGVRMPGPPNVFLPMPPPELNLDLWKESIKKLRSQAIEAIAPTHFGIYSDVEPHLDRVEAFIEGVGSWLKRVRPEQHTVEEMRTIYSVWFRENLSVHGIDPSEVDRAEIINPTFMSGDGLWRYWNKVRMPKTTP
jgi:glyoxylase-like metal-dependent hydrolase (beta-lactamase superfamily II)